jgi:hypothetical protein
MSWRSRLENTQNHAPEDLGMTELAYKDVGKAVKRIQELEQQLGDLCQDEHLRLEAALREIRHQLWLNSQITGPMTNFARKIDEIAKQALKGGDSIGSKGR